MTLLNHHWTRRQSGIISPPTRDEAFPTISNALSTPTPATWPPFPQPIIPPLATPTPLSPTLRTVIASTGTALLKTTCLNDQRDLGAGAQILPQATVWALIHRHPGTSGGSIYTPLVICIDVSVVGVDTYLSPSGGNPQSTTKTPVSHPHPLPSG